MKYVLTALFACCMYMTALSQPPVAPLLQRLQASTDTAKCEAYLHVADYYNLVQEDSSLYYIEAGLQYARQLKSKKYMARFMDCLARNDLKVGNVDKSRERFDSSILLGQQVENQPPVFKASSYSGLGMLDAKQGRFDDAIANFLKAQVILMTTKDTPQIARNYLRLGAVREQMNDFKESLDYYNKGLALVKHTRFINDYVAIISNVGVVYAKQGDMKTALAYFTEALEVVKNEPKMVQTYLLQLINVGKVYEQTGQLDKALGYQRQALTLATKLNWVEQQANVLLGMGSLMIETQPDSSEYYLKKALVMTTRIQQRFMAIDVYDALLDLYKQKGDYKQALWAAEQKHALSDSVLNIEKSRKIASLEKDYALAQSKIKIQNLQMANATQRTERNTLIYIAVGVLLLLLVVVFFWVRTGRLNKKLIRQRTELTQLNTVKDKMFSIISHDLRSPLATILSTIPLMDDEGISTQDKHMIAGQLHSQTSQTLDMLDKLLLWGRSQLAGGHSVDIQTIDTGPVVAANLNWISHTAEAKHIQLSDHTTPHQVKADAVHLDFILRNLLANAVKFTREGGTVSISSTASRHAGMVTFCISDTGVGISVERLPALFSFDGNSTRGTANEKGTSLGLKLCKEFIEENNGLIEVESQEAKGTRIHVSFPAA
jgi:signal transduction histidine kinase